jgi:hypothetical protein
MGAMKLCGDLVVERTRGGRHNVGRTEMLLFHLEGTWRAEETGDARRAIPRVIASVFDTKNGTSSVHYYKTSFDNQYHIYL